MSSTAVSAGASTRAVRVLCGPTAAGKSALAMRLAQAVDAAIVSADSRQVYHGFDVGTAKPTPDEQRRVPHFGIDLVDPHRRYSASDWAAAAPSWLTAARERQREPLVVGGTGFYLRALFAPLFDAPPLDPDRRAALETWLSTRPTVELQRWCRILDPARAALGRTQLLRAIETAVLTGHRISELHATRGRAPVLTARYLVVDPGRALGGAIVERTDAMLAAGWVEEVRTLAATVAPGAPAWTATGYDVLRRVISGELDLAAAREQVIVATRQYAKRQRTWFRHQLPAGTPRLDPGAPDAFDRLLAWWQGGE
ncbi:MAG TPA: tRNA (adenosine(37)-N6)-dimethylallyltransferase MiaA [Gemmatimonadaceae bacterium]|nr:tRNA (adenosine(37)-N6)-dimethylallyltransferase MiaA [Gemmatimonadaceae bacterium]